MATGILALDGAEAGLPRLGDALFWLAAAAYAPLALLLVLAVARGRARFEFPFFAVTAAGDVLAVVLVQRRHTAAAAVLGAVDLGLWVALLAPAAARLRARARPRGDWLLLVVSTQSLAALAATLATRSAGGVLRPLALALLVLGVVLYAVVAVVLVPRVRALRRAGAEGDDWILLGALAISAVAADRCALAEHHADRLVDISIGLWSVALTWLPLLLAAERVRLRTRLRAARAGARSWSRVFPLGMLAAATFAVATLLHAQALRDVAIGFFGVALATWSLTLAGAALNVRGARSAARPAPARRRRRGTASRSG
jgi:tellurite resistance protein TehA-like permease